MEQTVREELRDRKLLILLAILFLAAFLIRINYFYSEYKQDLKVEFDQASYQGIAKSIILYHDFSGGERMPLYENTSSNRNPGYPLMLTGVYLIFSSFKPMILINVFLSSIIPILIYFLARLYFSKKIAVLSSIISLVYPTFLFYINHTQPEIPITVLFTISWYLFMRFMKTSEMKFLIASSVMQSVCTYFRGESFFLTFVMFAIILFKGKLFNGKLFSGKTNGTVRFNTKQAAIFLILALLIVAPWSIRQYSLGLGPFPVEAWGGYYGLWLTARFHVSNENDPTYNPHEDHISFGSPFPMAERRSLLLNETIAIFKANPLNYIGGVFENLRLLLFESPSIASGRLSSVNFSGAISRHEYFIAFAKAVSTVSTDLINILALVGIALYFKKAWLLSVPYLYKLVMHSLVMGQGRYIVPVAPIAIIFASALLVCLSKIAQGLKPRT